MRTFYHLSSIPYPILSPLPIAHEKIRLAADGNLSQSQPFGRNSFNLFFDKRLEKVLSGKYGLHEFKEPQEIHQVLESIFEKPLIYNYDGKRKWQRPIWWFRGTSSNEVTRFHTLGGNQYLISHDELIVDKAYIYRDRKRLDKSFLYTECNPLPMKYLTKEEVDFEMKWRQGENLDPFVTETLAYSTEKNTYISLGKYHSEMAIYDWMLEELGADQVRRRFVTKYNRFFASNESFMNSQHEYIHKELCDKLLKEKIDIKQFLEYFLQLPPETGWVEMWKDIYNE